MPNSTTKTYADFPYFTAIPLPHPLINTTVPYTGTGTITNTTAGLMGAVLGLIGFAITFHYTNRFIERWVNDLAVRNALRDMAAGNLDRAGQLRALDRPLNRRERRELAREMRRANRANQPARNH
jgi:hypothetical protein